MAKIGKLIGSAKIDERKLLGIRRFYGRIIIFTEFNEDI